MNKIKEALWKDYREISNLINDVNDSDSDKYELLLEERDKVRNELIKLKQIDTDANVKMVQIKSDNKREKVRNIINIGTFTITTIFSIYTVYRTFKFDEKGTITSTLGRNTLNSVIPKPFKR